MTRREREILSQAVHAVAKDAAKAVDLVNEAIEVGHGRPDPLVTHAKILRLELLKVKADLERGLEDLSLNCKKCFLDVHWVSDLGITPGRWGTSGARAARQAGSLKGQPTCRPFMRRAFVPPPFAADSFTPITVRYRIDKTRRG